MSDAEQEYSEEEQYEEESEEEAEEEIEEDVDENEEHETQSIIDTPNNLIEQVSIREVNKRTPNRLTKFEATEANSIRIFQIQNGDKAYVPTAGFKSVDEIAAAELLKGKSPLTISRYIGTKIMPDGKPCKIYENIKVNDMHL